LGGVYFLARELHLQLTARLFQGFFAVLILILVVIYQHELRRAFERIALYSFRLRRPAKPSSEVTGPLIAAVADLAFSRRGAIIVLPGRDPLEQHLSGGVLLDGRLSYPLLLSLFDPNSAGHDGAVVLDGSRVKRFGAHLPLSRDFAQLGSRGTRHSAALGLSELTDALCIVVSEERGVVSMARDGFLCELSRAEDLIPILDAFCSLEPPPRRSLRLRLPNPLRHWRERGIAVGLSLGLWLFLVSGEQVSRQVFHLPVAVDHVPDEYMVGSVAPQQVEVTLSGMRRDFYLFDPSGLRVDIDAFLVGQGRRTFAISRDDVHPPEGLNVVDIEPRSVTLSVRPADRDSARNQHQFNASRGIPGVAASAASACPPEGCT
jgi:DNA integrity scanning protein DisA with diadenylate cyclase activity